jgi:hypothetical protein
MDVQKTKHKNQSINYVEEDKQRIDVQSNDQHIMEEQEKEGMLDLVKALYMFV